MGDISLRRRTFLRGGLAAAASGLCGFGVATEAQAAGSRAGSAGWDAVSYVSRPDLQPPRISLSQVKQASQGGASSQGRYIFLTPQGRAAQSGVLILDRQGDTVWFQPAPPHGMAKNFSVQTYRGEPVLTWWETSRQLPDKSMGAGVAYIADASYKVIATVRAGNGLPTDFHDFTITDRNTALINTFRTESADLSVVGGPRNGSVIVGVLQEIDIATGAVVFEWNSLDHVNVAETLYPYDPKTDPVLDYFHLNSMAVAHDGDLLISARNTCTVYKIGREDGGIKWQLGGSKSSFPLEKDAVFWWQHDVREPRPGVLSIFDDGSQPKRESQSRGILLKVDPATKRASLLRAYTSPEHPLASTQGSIQILPDGDVFVGWGLEPSFSQFTAAGEQVLYGRLPSGDYSYRAFAQDWTGRPDDAPAAVACSDRSGGTVIYLSWNGATSVASWEVSAGDRPTSLHVVGRQQRLSFETAIAVRSDGPYFSAAALDARGRVLRRTAVVRRTDG
jgi:Arylsulfotransferase (ASST)